MDLFSVSRLSIDIVGKRSSRSNCQSAIEKVSDWQGRKQKREGRFSSLLVGETDSQNFNSLVREDGELTRLSGARKEKAINKYDFSKLDRMLVLRAAKPEQESKEKTDNDEQTKLTKKNEQSDRLWRGDEGPTALSRVQIFSSTLFWVFMFYMASIWDRENTFRRGRGGDRNNRQ